MEHKYFRFKKNTKSKRVFLVTGGLAFARHELHQRLLRGALSNLFFDTDGII